MRRKVIRVYILKKQNACYVNISKIFKMQKSLNIYGVKEKKKYLTHENQQLAIFILEKNNAFPFLKKKYS